MRDKEEGVMQESCDDRGRGGPAAEMDELLKCILINTRLNGGQSLPREGITPLNPADKKNGRG